MTREDLDGVAELYGQVFSKGNGSQDETVSYLNHVLFENPWFDSALPSYVYQKENRIAGCLGVVPRRMRLNGSSLQVVTTCHFMVAPAERSTMAGVELLRRVLQGPQDLSVAEGNDPSMRLWTAIGGAISVTRSMYWIKVLRPAGYALLQLKQALPKFLTAPVMPLAKLADAFAMRIRRSPFQLKPCPPGEELPDEAVPELMRDFSSHDGIHPEYNVSSWRWVMELVSAKAGGPPCKVLVRHNGRTAGWYVLKSTPEKICMAVQVGAGTGKYAELFQQMSYHAAQLGAVALIGRVEPRFFREVPRSCVFRKSWMLAHARDASTLVHFDAATAFFSLLEGEWAVIP